MKVIVLCISDDGKECDEVHNSYNDCQSPTHLKKDSKNPHELLKRSCQSIWPDTIQVGLVALARVRVLVVEPRKTSRPFACGLHLGPIRLPIYPSAYFLVTILSSMIFVDELYCNIEDSQRLGRGFVLSSVELVKVKF